MTQEIEKYLGQIVNAYHDLRKIADFEIVEMDYSKHEDAIKQLQGFYPDGVMACVTQGGDDYLFTIAAVTGEEELYYLAVMHDPERFISKWKRQNGPDKESSQWEMLEYDSNFGISSDKLSTH